MALGILNQLEKDGTQVLDDRIVFRPFPIAIADAAERKRRWKSYREDMLSFAGVALFLFGNKKDPSGSIVPADGVEEEFDLATANGLAVVSVGSTGGKAAELHKRVLDNFDDYYPIRGYKRLFQELGKSGSAQQVSSRVLAFVEKLRHDRALQDS